MKVSAFRLLLTLGISLSITPHIFAASPITVTSAQEKICSEQYHLGSVEASLSASSSRIMQGETITFSGELHNTNPYPVTDASVYVRIFRVMPESTFKDANGDFIVDQFMALRNINIMGASSKSFSFNWRSPKTLLDGEYRMALYVVSSGRMNISGLPYEDDVAQVSEYFKVGPLGQAATGPVEWNKYQVRINDNPHLFAQPIATFSQDEPVTIYAPVINRALSARTAKIIWTTYNWDDLLTSNVIASSEETVNLGPNESKRMMLLVPKSKGPVTYVVGKIESLDGVSFINVRFARTGFEEVRITSSLLTQFPIKKDDTASLFSCFNSTSLLDATDTKLVMMLKNKGGDVIAQSEYTGTTTGDVMAMQGSFFAKKDITDVTLVTTLFKHGVQVDSVETKYSCKSLNQGDCTQRVYPIALILKSIGALVGIALLVLLGFFIKKKLTPKEPYEEMI